MPATIEIDLAGRWDAVALMQRLGPYHPYLIQFAPEHWLVHAQCPGRHGERVPSAPPPASIIPVRRALAEGLQVEIGVVDASC